jgi:hypothetical protein
MEERALVMTSHPWSWPFASALQLSSPAVLLQPTHTQQLLNQKAQPVRVSQKLGTNINFGMIASTAAI